jgi:hypothetical protein
MIYNTDLLKQKLYNYNKYKSTYKPANINYHNVPEVPPPWDLNQAAAIARRAHNLDHLDRKADAEARLAHRRQPPVAASVRDEPGRGDDEDRETTEQGAGEIGKTLGN